jgi:hypothetical protein
LLGGAYFDDPLYAHQTVAKGAAEISILNDVSSVTPGDPTCIAQMIEIERALTASVMLR